MLFKYNMGTNYYLYFQGREYHIGKSSGGYKFIFDIALLEFWSFTLGVDHPLAVKVRPYIQRIFTGRTYYERSIEPEAISDLREEDVINILRTEGVVIKDEYGIQHTVPDFLAFVRSKSTGEDTFSRKDNFLGKFYRDFCIGSYIFSDGMDFC